MPEILPEEWRPVKGYEGLYEVSNTGKVKSITTQITRKDGRKFIRNGKILKQHKNKYGYWTINIYKNGVNKLVSVHIIVGFAFLPPCPGKHGKRKDEYCIDHMDKNKDNNNSANLQWLLGSLSSLQGNYSENRSYNNVTGSNNARSKLNYKDIINIRRDNRSITAIAKDYGIGHTTVKRILTNESWKHIPYDNWESQSKMRMQRKCKLSKEDIKKILLDKRSLSKIAQDYNITATSVHKLKQGKSHKKVVKELLDEAILSIDLTKNDGNSRTL